MFDVIAVIIALSGVAVLASAALIGAVLPIGRADHRNPVAYRWIAWHDRHSAFRH